MAKPRLATVSLCGCFGCHMSLLDLDERMLDLVELVDFDRSPINDIKRFAGTVDIGVVEGGCCNAENVKVLREFREHCRVLISVGDCAIHGGVPALRNLVPLEECLRLAVDLGEVAPNEDRIPTRGDRAYRAARARRPNSERACSDIDGLSLIHI